MIPLLMKNQVLHNPIRRRKHQRRQQKERSQQHPRRRTQRKIHHQKRKKVVVMMVVMIVKQSATIYHKPSNRSSVFLVVKLVTNVPYNVYPPVGPIRVMQVVVVLNPTLSMYAAYVIVIIAVHTSKWLVARSHVLHVRLYYGTSYGLSRMICLCSFYFSLQNVLHSLCLFVFFVVYVM